jgi:hypothetical protein
MKLPTAEEIQHAYEAITRDGPAADDTIGLGIAAVKDQHLKAFVDRLVTHLVPALGCDKDLLRGALSGAMIYGLNVGLRIGEMRLRAGVAAGKPL